METIVAFEIIAAIRTLRKHGILVNLNVLQFFSDRDLAQSKIDLRAMFKENIYRRLAEQLANSQFVLIEENPSPMRNGIEIRARAEVIDVGRATQAAEWAKAVVKVAKQC